MEDSDLINSNLVWQIRNTIVVKTSLALATTSKWRSEEVNQIYSAYVQGVLLLQEIEVASKFGVLELICDVL